MATGRMGLSGWVGGLIGRMHREGNNTMVGFLGVPLGLSARA